MLVDIVSKKATLRDYQLSAGYHDFEAIQKSGVIWPFNPKEWNSNFVVRSCETQTIYFGK